MLRFWRARDEGADDGPRLGGVALGPRPWLVLGGGGLKGLTHLGAIRVLYEHGFEPAGILGTSIGALVGACAAGGADPVELLERGRRLQRADIARLERRAVWVNGFRAQALFRRKPLRDYFAEVLPESWEELEIRFQANAVELGTGRTEWFGIGARTDVRLADAVYASAALPVFYPPARLPGGIYVDGAVEHALPLHRAVELGATGIVAVDPGSAEETDGPAVAEAGMLAVHHRVFSIMSGRLRRASVEGWDGPPLLYIRPRLEGYGSFDFEHIPYFLEEGERHAREVLGEAEPAVGGPSGGIAGDSSDPGEEGREAGAGRGQGDGSRESGRARPGQGGGSSEGGRGRPGERDGSREGARPPGADGGGRRGREESRRPPEQEAEQPEHRGGERPESDGGERPNHSPRSSPSASAADSSSSSALK